jgi:hypothetical protein
LTRAERIIETERQEVEAERKAFSEFEERVADIGTTSTAPTDLESPLRTAMIEQSQRGGERIRTVFRETVMSVDHYDEIYGETLEDHATAELSGDIAAILQPEVATPFTEWHKATLISAVGSAIVRRRRFLNHLGEELASISENRTALTELVESCDEVNVSNRSRTEFENRLEGVAKARQEQIQGRDTPPRTDGHNLCYYLYQNCEWTYPILTAVTRLRSHIL